MGSPQVESEEKQEMDDSGCIQDESPPSKKGDVAPLGVQLLDLSDDVLLLILKFLTPRDLRALGYTCPRLGALILDRSLWQYVDARAQPWTSARLRWYLTRALHAGTRALRLAGFAREANTCLGNVNQTREEMEAARLAAGEGRAEVEGGRAKEEDNNNSSEQEQSDSQSGHSDRSQSPRIVEAPAAGPNAQRIDDDREQSPEAWAWPGAPDPLTPGSACSGPLFTLAPGVLAELADTCPALDTLALEYCNINCNTTSISQFPPTLKNLSLKGSKCYNLPLDRSFLFKIQDTLPGLETLDVSECEWMEPASLLPLSKLPALKHLYARDCLRLTEFVAYASLATRYGFTKLQCLDLRGSPVGDSEVSALGWLSSLTALWLAPLSCRTPRPRTPRPRPAPHADRWEEAEPEYFKIKEPVDLPRERKSSNTHTWHATVKQGEETNGHSGQNNNCAASTSNGIQKAAPSPASPPRVAKRKPSPSPSPSPNQPSHPSPGPSKRSRPTQEDGDTSSDDDIPLKTLVNQHSERVHSEATTSRASPREQPPGDQPPQNEQPQDREAEPRHHVLYVNVGQQLHAVYRLSLDNEHVVFNRNPSTRSMYLSPPAHLDATSLVTDSAIRRFGRADGADINYVHIGPNGPYAAPGARPDRSSLTHLSVTGFRHITDRSLEHLATSAPRLRFLDFSETNVTEAGVAAFRSLRPECEVRFSPYVERKE